ncbi:MAG: hypothetical protein ABJA78_16565, partial [Ferruginibacter sp.]
MKLKSCLLLIPVLFYSAIAFSQNSIVGTWEGKFLSQDFELGQPKLVVEIYDFKGSSFTGVSHLYYRENKYEHYRIVGLYDEKDSVLAFKEVSTIAVDLGTYGNCLGTYMMSLKKADGYLVQNGFWEATIRGCTSNSNIWLQKKIEEIKKPEPKIKPAPTKPIPNKPVVKNKPPVIVQPARDRITTPVIA